VIVVDASIVIEVLLQTKDGLVIGEKLLIREESLHAPHLIDVEIAQVLRRYVLRGELYAERARQALDVLAEFPLTRYAHEPLLGRMWALRENLTAYDAAYVALAEGLRVPLLTRDRRISAAPGLATSVEVL
jgi:predicted nucleic acid-binding protein